MGDYIKRVAGGLIILAWAASAALAEDAKAPNVFQNAEPFQVAFKAGLEKQKKKDYAGALIEYEKALRFSPNDASIHINKGIEYFRQNDTPSAVKEFQEAYTRFPPLTMLYTACGETRRNVGDYYAAILDLTIATTLRPDYAPIYGIRGECRSALEDFEAAIGDYDEAIARGSRIPHGYYMRGRAKFSLGRTTEAIADYTLAVNLDPSYLQGYYSRALAYSLLGQWDKAMADDTKLVELAPKNPVSYMRRAWLELLQGNNAAALKDYAVAETCNPLPLVLATIARDRATVYDIMDDQTRAADSYQSALQDPHRNMTSEAEVYLHLQYDLFQLRVSHAPLKLGPYFDDVADWKDNWSKRVVLYLKGRITAESLLKAAAQEKLFFPRRQRECEAQYYIGFAEMLAGNTEAARQRFATCVAMQHNEYYEHLLAVGHLQRLAQSR